MKKRVVMGRVSKMRKVYKCTCGSTVTLVIRRRKDKPWPPIWPPIGGQCRSCFIRPYLPIDENEN